MHPDPNPKNPLHLNHLFLCIGPFPYVPPSYRSMQTPVIQKKEKIPKEFVLDLKIPTQNLRFPNKNCFPDTKQTPKKSTSSQPFVFSAPCKPPDLKSPKRNPHQPKSTWIISQKSGNRPKKSPKKSLPKREIPTWIFAFSQRIHNSSFLSMSCVPVKFRVSTAWSLLVKTRGCRFGSVKRYIYIFTHRKFNIGPEKWWLEDKPFLLGR